MSENERSRTDALEAAGKRRVELKGAVSQVEIAAASPAADPDWRDRMVRELHDLRLAWDQHVDEVEGDDGLLAELTQQVPRLANQIREVQSEHPAVRAMIEAAIGSARDEPDVDAVRTEVLQVLLAVARHRQKGADLVYEGYNIDIGGG